MSELTGLELRKALCEALGYHVEAVSYEFSKEPWFNLLRSDGKRVDNGGHVEPSSPWKDGPALESDPGVFWPEFEKWCGSFSVNRPGFSVADDSGNDGKPLYRFFLEVWCDNWVACLGLSSQSVLDAGCRAWLHALETLKSKAR